MADARGPDRRRDVDLDLEATLGALAAAIDWPAPGGPPAGPDLATRVRVRLDDAAADRAGRRSRWRPRWSPVRRAAVLALVALLALAAVAAALRLGVPGIGIELGRPAGTASPSPAPTASPAGAGASPRASAVPGADLGLGQPVPVEDAGARAGLELRLPSAAVVGGPPDAAYVNLDGVLSLVWSPSADLPATVAPDVGLLLTAFEGRTGPDVINKLVATGTTVERLTIGGRPAFWLSGDPHFFYFLDEQGRPVESTRRWVGDTLLWTDGDVTYRLESSLGRDASVRIAESLE